MNLLAKAGPRNSTDLPNHSLKTRGVSVASGWEAFCFTARLLRHGGRRRFEIDRSRADLIEGSLGAVVASMGNRAHCNAGDLATYRRTSAPGVHIVHPPFKFFSQVRSREPYFVCSRDAGDYS